LIDLMRVKGEIFPLYDPPSIGAGPSPQSGRLAATMRKWGSSPNAVAGIAVAAKQV
jgi:hypothetical protein